MVREVGNSEPLSPPTQVLIIHCTATVIQMGSNTGGMGTRIKKAF